jgi:NitT/TauT family transport system ATP-binding protein
LHDCPDGTLRADFFLDILQEGFGTRDAQRQFDIAIGWGRYAELFDYNSQTGQIAGGTGAETPVPVLTGGVR